MNKEGNRRLKALLLGGVVVCLGACGGGGSSSGVSTLYAGAYAGVETTTLYHDGSAVGNPVTRSSGFVVSSGGQFSIPTFTPCQRGGTQESVISMGANTGSYSYSGTCESTAMGACSVESTDVLVFSAQGATRTTEFSAKCDSGSLRASLKGIFQKVSG